MTEARVLNSTCNSYISGFYYGNNNKNNRFASVIFSDKSAIFSCRGLSYPSLKLRDVGVKSRSSSSEFFGGKVAACMFGVDGSIRGGAASNSQMSIRIGKAQKWWEKGLRPNMKEVSGAQDFVDSLLKAGDKLVIVDFFSPGCGGCKALHPKICQLAELNPDVQFLQVNYEEHKLMCYSLNVHVLPFFRFYRGAEGRVCSFSCTNATIKKFKDALARYSPDRCSLGKPKGLEEKELLALAANKDLSFTYTPEREEPVLVPAEVETPREASPAPSLAFPPLPLPLPLPLPSTSPKATQDAEEKSMVNTGR